MYPYFVSIISICTYLEGAWSSANVISSSRAAEMDRGMDQETILGKRQTCCTRYKGKQPRLLTASLVEPLQSGSLAHVQYTESHVTLYTVFLRGYWRLDTLVIMYSWYDVCTVYHSSAGYSVSQAAT